MNAAGIHGTVLHPSCIATDDYCGVTRNLNHFSLLKAELPSGSEHLNFKKLRADVYKRKAFAFSFALSRYNEDLPFLLNPAHYSFDGSLVISRRNFQKYAPNFFRRSRRTIGYGDRVHLRGGRYIISSNPTFELRQKLETFAQDLDEGLDSFSECESPFFRLAIADYIKNSVLTMLNSFLNEEKIGKYKFTNLNYRALRQEAHAYSQTAVNAFYGTLLQDYSFAEKSVSQLTEKRTTFDSIQAYILEEYHRGAFSSRHITRPEASHPLVIAMAVQMYLTSSNSDNLDLIVGLPSGSTELALAHALGYRLQKKKPCEVILFPVSLHSAKNDFDNFKMNKRNLARWAKHHRRTLEGKNLLLVDDNSSTGRTIQMVVDALQAASPKAIDVAVAEADLVRSELDLLNIERESVASASLYKYSTNVLPVSRTISPKTDLKELFERKKMVICTKGRYEAADRTFSEFLVGQVYQDLIMNPTDSVLESKNASQVRQDFRKTFLSNFYPVEVHYSGQKFDSVEHAYQAMKFEPGTWEKITDKDLTFINRRLPAGSSLSLEQLPIMFTLPDLSAGTSKTAANCLRVLGYVRTDWDDVKASIMTELLLQKFSNHALWQMLMDTGELYLIEGNDWNDTYWGVCDGRGRNVLGRLLMAIRSTEFDVIKKEALCLVQQHLPT